VNSNLAWTHIKFKLGFQSSLKNFIPNIIFFFVGPSDYGFESLNQDSNHIYRTRTYILQHLTLTPFSISLPRPQEKKKKKLSRYTIYLLIGLNCTLGIPLSKLLSTWIINLSMCLALDLWIPFTKWNPLKKSDGLNCSH
jgi:hypothetical protein